MFIADLRGLDFLNSIATPVDKPIEFIGCGEDFLAWLRDALLVPAGVLATLQDRAVPGELDDVAAQARALREWFRDFVVEYRGKPLPMNAAKKLEPLNQLLARDEEFGQIVPRDRRHGDEAPSQAQMGGPELLAFAGSSAYSHRQGDGGIGLFRGFLQYKGVPGSHLSLFFLTRPGGARDAGAAWPFVEIAPSKRHIEREPSGRAADGRANDRLTGASSDLACALDPLRVNWSVLPVSAVVC